MTATWRIEGDQIEIAFSITADRTKNKELLRHFGEQDNTSWAMYDMIALIGEKLRLTSLQRVEGFVRLWSEVKYNFAFFDQVPGLDWDSVLAEYLPVVQEDQSDYEYYRVLQRCLARLHDGHTSIIGNGPPYVVARPPLELRPVEGKVLIVSVDLESDTAGGMGLAPGMEITHVDGRSVKDIFETDLYPYISASTSQQRDFTAYPRLLDGPKDSEVSVQVRNQDGKSRTVTLVRNVDLGSLGRPSAIVEYRQFPDKISYVALNSFGSDLVVKEFEKVFNRIQNSNGLIIDVRTNGGGSTSHAHAVIRHLTDKALKGSKWKTRQYMPAFRAWGQEEEWYEGGCDMVKPIEGKKPFLGPLVVLVGPGTISAAEDFLIPLHSSGRAILVGEPTTGSTGQPLVIKLPGRRKRARICTKWDSYPDGREFVGIGVIPDVEVYPTQQDIAEGWDPVLEKALEVLKAQLQK